MKALILIANNGFQDWEFYYPKTALENAGFDITIASSKKGDCTSKLGKINAYADNTLDELKGDDYDIVVFVGGPGVVAEFNNDMNYIRIFEEAMKASVVGAICIAPTVLSKSKFFDGKKVTGFDAGAGEQINTIKNNGGIFTGEDVQVDGKFITANGPDAAEKFADKILEVYNS